VCPLLAGGGSLRGFQEPAVVRLARTFSSRL
jgi:hypothetical protein